MNDTAGREDGPASRGYRQMPDPTVTPPALRPPQVTSCRPAESDVSTSRRTSYPDTAAPDGPRYRILITVAVSTPPFDLHCTMYTPGATRSFRSSVPSQVTSCPPFAISPLHSRLTSRPAES